MITINNDYYSYNIIIIMTITILLRLLTLPNFHFFQRYNTSFLSWQLEQEG